jgi:hypothetical protein
MNTVVNRAAKNEASDHTAGRQRQKRCDTDGSADQHQRAGAHRHFRDEPAACTFLCGARGSPISFTAATVASL